IDRIFERIAIADAGPERAGIAIANDLPVVLGDEIRQAARYDIAAAAGNFLDAWRHLLERGDPVQYVMRVNRGDRGNVLVPRRADRVIGDLHSTPGQITRIGLPSR